MFIANSTSMSDFLGIVFVPMLSYALFHFTMKKWFAYDPQVTLPGKKRDSGSLLIILLFVLFSSLFTFVRYEKKTMAIRLGRLDPSYQPAPGWWLFSDDLDNTLYN
ncbi:MAG: hypothetical protein V4736_05060 [Bdellovibrionota bacterium]